VRGVLFDKVHATHGSNPTLGELKQIENGVYTEILRQPTIIKLFEHLLPSESDSGDESDDRPAIASSPWRVGAMRWAVHKYVQVRNRMSHCYIKRQAIEAAPFSRASPSQERAGGG